MGRGVSDIAESLSADHNQRDFISDGTRGGFCGSLQSEHKQHVEEIRQFQRQHQQWGQTIGLEETKDVFVIDDADSRLLRESVYSPLRRPTTFTVINDDFPRDRRSTMEMSLMEEVAEEEMVMPDPEMMYQGRSKESIMIMNDCDDFALRDDSEEEDGRKDWRIAQQKQHQQQQQQQHSNQSSSQCTPHNTLIPSVVAHMQK